MLTSALFPIFIYLSSPWDTDDSEISVLPAPETAKPTHESDLDDLFSSDDDDDDEQPQGDAIMHT